MESTNDIILTCVDSVPIPGLQQVFDVYKKIWNTVKVLAMEAMQQQLFTLSGALAYLLQTLDREHRTGRLAFGNTAREIAKLDCLLKDVLDFVNALAAAGFLKHLLRHNENTQAVKHFHKRINYAVQAFNIGAFLDIQRWLVQDTAARSNDQRKFHDHLSVLEANQNQLAETLKAQHSSVMAMMISLQKSLDNKSISDKREEQFIRHSLNYLVSTSQQQAHIDSWTITSFEVEFGELIGSGGFGQVYRGTWNRTQVALKVLKSQEGGIAPSAEMIRKEIETWSKLRHPHVLQFLGANIVDETPFIVMPFLRNGNAWCFVLANPDCDRIKILRDVSLGLVHLHSQHIIHGDLKALNVLIDDGHNALLCDFGLSRSRADALSRSTTRKTATPAVGSRNWMAPELFLGRGVRKPVDVYAFGMTIYEIMAMKTPLGHIPVTDFIHLVVDRNVRPERPPEDDVQCQGLSGDLWRIAERCWVKEPNDRPNVTTLCDEMERCLASHRESKVTSSSSPLLSKGQTGSSTRGTQFISSPEPILESRDKSVTLRRQVTSYPPTLKAPETLNRLSSQRSQQNSSQTSNPSLPLADVDWIDINSSAGSTKQSPPPANSQQRSLRNRSKRPLTIEELDARARDDLWDGKEALGHYLTIAGRFRNDGNDLQARGDHESAYVHFAKAAALVLEKIPLHRGYMNLSAEKQRNLATNGKYLTDKLEELKQAQVDRLHKWERSTRY